MHEFVETLHLAVHAPAFNTSSFMSVECPKEMFLHPYIVPSKGMYDTATPRAHFWTSSLSIACKPMRAELVQFLFVELRLARFQLTRAQVNSFKLNSAQS